MRMSPLFLSTLVLAFTAGCKSKQAMPARTATDPAPVVTAQAANSSDPSTPTNAKADPIAPIGPDSVYFSLEHTPCYGTCPAYMIIINQDGSAVYLGRRFAAREGRYVGTVDAATMKQLYDQAVAVDFFAMQDKYDQPVTDLPSTIIRVNANGKDKQVVGRVGPPQGFKDFAQEADRILAHVEWTKTGDLR
ncbi:MAG: DUF6438 domain-containing protein [Flavobacteriales bacterium]